MEPMKDNTMIAIRQDDVFNVNDKQLSKEDFEKLLALMVDIKWIVLNILP